MSDEPALSHADPSAFAHGEGFARGEVAGGLELGPLETQYQELFAEVLEDGVITSEERTRLEKAADNLGLEPSRLFKLEQAMVASYETRNRVRVVEHYEEAPASLAPIHIAEAGDTGRQLLEKRIQTLEALIKNATIIDENHSTDHVQIGSTVGVETPEGKDTFTIVGSAEAKPAEGRISNESPVGRALLGKKKGEKVVVKVPAGDFTYKIVSIS